ncbi:hypothetical protein Tco_0618726 [Tanacetum coccineum]
MLLRAIHQAPAYPRISWCGPGNPSISGFPSIKAEAVGLEYEHTDCHAGNPIIGYPCASFALVFSVKFLSKCIYLKPTCPPLCPFDQSRALDEVSPFAKHVLGIRIPSEPRTLVN